MSESLPDLLRRRRTVHRFEPGSAPPESVITAAIECAVRAPNHHLTQPWRFTLLGPKTVDRICLLNAELVREQKGDRAAEVKLKHWRDVPGWLLLSCVRAGDEVQRREDFAACCCAAQNLMLYLWNEGIGVKWTTGAVTRDVRFFDLVGLDPEQEEVVGLFWYGTPAEVPETARHPLEAVLRHRD